MAYIFAGDGSGSKHTPSAITSSGEQGGNLDDYVDDGDNTTRWWGNSGSAWIKIDLGSSKLVSHIKFAKGAGDTSVIEGSDNDSDWTSVAAVPSTGSSGSGTLDHVVLELTDGPHTYRYWRFTDTGGNWPQIWTIELYPAWTLSSPAAGVASRVYQNFALANMIDGDDGTYWSSDGGAGWGGIDLGEVLTVTSVTIDPGGFTADVEGSTDGVSWDTIEASHVFSDDVAEVIAVAADYRFIRVDAAAWRALREFSALIPASAVISGTAVDGGVLEAEIVAGAQTLILTLTGDTWHADIGSDNAQTTALIAGLDSAGAEAAGWDAVVKAGLTYVDVVRTSDTVATITFPAFASYAITADEVITATIPATAVAGASEIVATPTLTVTNATPVVDEDEGGMGVMPNAQSWRLNTNKRKFGRSQAWK